MKLKQYLIIFLILATPLNSIAVPIINSSNGSVEVNLTQENIKQAGNTLLNSTTETVNDIKKDLPDKVTVKAGGFEFILALASMLLIRWFK